MTEIDVNADLLVDNGSGGTRALSVDDLKTPATGAASETKLEQLRLAVVAADTARNSDDDALRTLVSDRLVASILTDPVVAAAGEIRDRLPAALNADGGVKAHITNLPATQPVSAASLPLPAGAATDANLTDLLSRVGPTASDTLLSLLRQVVTNTATEAAKVTHLDLTADTLNLSTDGIEGLLTTLNALVSSEATLTALKSANHTDLVALATAFATLNAKDFATQTTAAATLAKLTSDPSTGAKQDTANTSLAAILAKQIAAPATEAKQDSLITANHTDLLAVIAKNEQIRALLAATLLVERATVTSAAPTQVAASASSVTLIASNSAARLRTVYNDSSSAMYVKYGTTASSTSFNVKIAGGGYFEFPNPLYTGRVDAIWVSATGNAYVTEG